MDMASGMAPAEVANTPLRVRSPEDATERLDFLFLGASLPLAMCPSRALRFGGLGDRFFTGRFVVGRLNLAAADLKTFAYRIGACADAQHG